MRTGRRFALGRAGLWPPSATSPGLRRAPPFLSAAKCRSPSSARRSGPPPTALLPGGPPSGVLDSVTAAQGQVTVRGWAIHPDTITPIAVHSYIDGSGTPWSRTRRALALPQPVHRADPHAGWHRDPTHHHHGEVHAWTISGTWGYREYPWQATVADYIYEEAGSTHTLFVPADMAEPAVVLFVIDGAQDYLDDTGEVFFTQTAEVVSDLYTQALQDRGIPVPASILP